jgi:hypothetical protein
VPNWQQATKDLHGCWLFKVDVKSYTSESNKLLKLQPHKVRTVQKPSSPDLEPRNQHCKWFQETVANGFFFYLERLIFLG